MGNNMLNLRTDNYYTLEDELVFFMDPGRYSKYFEQINGLVNDLKQAEYVLCNYVRKADNDGYYIMMTQNYKIFADCSDRQNFRITSLKWGRELQADKRKMYNNGAFLIIANGGIKLFVKKESHSPGTWWTSAQPETESDCMSATAINKLCSSIYEYFKNDNKADENRVGRLFDRQIMQPLQRYTYYEQQAEELSVYGANYVDYDRFQVASGSGARRKRYDFYSMSYDPDTELISVGSDVAVETIESISDERKRMLKGNVIDIALEKNDVCIQVEFKQQFDNQILKETHGHIYPQADETQMHVRQEVIRNIWNGTIESQYMYKLFASYKGSGYEPQPGWKEFQQTLKERHLNNEQMKAVQSGIETKDIQLVLGPPGTGKTTVIVTWVEYFVRQGKRVLISSQNNAAVDNVLERIGGKPGVRVVRLGNIDKIQDNCKQYSIEMQTEKTADAYIQRLTKSKECISTDISTIKNKNTYIDNAKDIYRTKGHYEEQLRIFGSKIRARARKVLDCYEKVGQSYNLYKGYHDQKVHKQVYLYAISQKGSLYQWLHSNVTKQVEQDVLDLKNTEEQAAIEYINSINEYNAASVLLQEALNDNDYHSTYMMIHSLNKQCNSYSFTVELQGPFRITDMVLPDNLDGTEAYKRLEDYQTRLRSRMNRLDYINGALDDWEKSIRSNRTEVVEKLVVENSNVVGATCIGINSNRWSSDLDFDVSIIDECGQIQIHDMIVPMTRAPKTLMLGDHKQIPPHADEEVKKLCEQDGVDTELLEESFFEFLFNKLEEKDPNTPNITRLNEQFRMPAVISDVIANQFYGGNYYAHYDMNKWKSMIRGYNSPLILITTSENQNRFERDKYNSNDKTPGYSNLLEADIIVDIISKKYIGKPEEVGIISAYSRQVRLIRQKLKNAMGELSDEQINSMVATLDSFQGQERPLIIYSLTRSSKDSNPNHARVGFLKELRRLNVAFTRCQKQLLIIGDIDYLTTCKYNKEEEEFSRFLRSMVNQAKCNGKYYEA